MGDPDELALVMKALKTGLKGCVEWDDDSIDRIRVDMAKFKLTPKSIIESSIEYARNGGLVHQVVETRPEWKNRRDHYYKIIIPMGNLFKKGLFVEIEIVDRDKDYPEVRLVNAHEQN